MTNRCSTCGRGEPCPPCAEGSPPPERLADLARERGGQCTRGCTHFRRHQRNCPVPDGAGSVQLPAEGPRTADGGAPVYEHACSGCKPRRATQGALCDQCHARMADWFGGTYTIAWAYGWLASDMEPRQNAAGIDKIMNGSKGPPAAMAVHIFDLRQRIAAELGTWLGMVCQQFGLHGPDWWRTRTDQAKRRAEQYGGEAQPGWRAWLSQDQAEVDSGVKYLAAWLDRIEAVPDVAASIYDTAENLMVRVASIAPWRAKPRNLPEIICPACERESLAIYEGSDAVQCRRCREIITRDRYDIWSVIAETEGVAS
jgi:hypothetical protein